MKLSEAIIKGGNYFESQDSGDDYFSEDRTCACALGGAIYAVLGDFPEDTDEFLDEFFPQLRQRVGAVETVADRIVFLNDVQGKTREQIAQWIIDEGYDDE